MQTNEISSPWDEITGGPGTINPEQQIFGTRFLLRQVPVALKIHKPHGTAWYRICKLILQKILGCCFDRNETYYVAVVFAQVDHRIIITSKLEISYAPGSDKCGTFQY